ncbi:hypothetical protein BV20DRAFT_1007549 [Pilatotrama ljubarskyi]|nr:hypothetical protein BV20DRAFT_1007549 [Pilatotrama ljubarskyi]
MRSFLPAAFLAAFAGQVLALNISIAGIPGNITASDFLPSSDPAFSACSNECAPALADIAGCGDTNDACLCSNATTIIPDIVKCEQCQFEQLIHDNRRPQDPRAGQTSAIAAYTTACSSLNFTIPANITALHVTPDWDGPFGQGLNTFGTVVSVIAATVLGSGMIAVVNTM